MNKKFQDRIGFEGEIKPVLYLVCEDFCLGRYKDHAVVELGYEDFNVVLETESGKYFIKFFANFRDEKDCLRYVNIIEKSIEAGVSCPKLLKSTSGHLYKTKFQNHDFRLVAMEYVEGESLYQSRIMPTKDEMRFIIKQAAIINQINLKPDFIYDSWEVVNFLPEFEKKKKYLNDDDLNLIEPIAVELAKTDIGRLPHCFVHGDLVTTNIMRKKSGQICIIDFAVGNYYPRIIELVVLFCNTLFDENDPGRTAENYDFALKEYQKYIKLTDQELKVLPLLVKATHALWYMTANFEKKAESNDGAENEHWLKVSKIGLKFCQDINFNTRLKKK